MINDETGFAAGFALGLMASAMTVGLVGMVVMDKPTECVEVVAPAGRQCPHELHTLAIESGAPLCICRQTKGEENEQRE